MRRQKTVKPMSFLKVMSLMAIFLVGFSAEALASSLLFVSPHRVVIEPGDRTTTVTVANQSDIKRSYKISMIDTIMTEQGVTQRVDTFPYSAKRMVRYVPRTVELAPGERQTVRIMVRRSRDLEDGDYHSHMLFREEPIENETDKNEEQSKKVSFEVGATYGVAIPVIVQVGDVKSSLEIADAGKDEAGNMTVTFEREGNAEASGYLRVYKVDGDKEVVISSPMWIRAYREVDNVTRRVSLLPEFTARGDLVLKLFADSSADAEVLDTFEVNL